MNDIDRSVTAVFESYKAAVFKKDADAFIKLYDPKVRVFDAWGIWSYDGATAWQRAVEAWFTSLGNEKVRASFADVQMSGSADMTAVSAIVTYAGVSADGAELRSMQNRLTWVLKTSGHVLRIIHEHTSAPIDFNELKAILQR